MIRFAAGNEEAAAVAQWVAERIPAVETGEGFGPCATMGVYTPAGALLAGVVFHDWQDVPRTMQLSMAADTPRWATRETVSALLRFGFVHQVVNVLWTATPHTNERAIRFNIGCGMKREATLRHRFGPGVHAVICSMTREEWKQSKWRTA